MYRIFDITIESEVDLPGLLHCESGEPAWRIVWAESAIDDTGFEWFHAWKDEDGTELMSCARKGGDYLLEIPGLARFRIHIDDGRIEAAALSDCPESTVVHLLLDQVIPRVTCHGGRIVIHASAVMMRNGQRSSGNWEGD